MKTIQTEEFKNFHTYIQNGFLWYQAKPEIIELYNRDPYTTIKDLIFLNCKFAGIQTNKNDFYIRCEKEIFRKTRIEDFDDKVCCTCRFFTLENNQDYCVPSSSEYINKKLIYKYGILL